MTMTSDRKFQMEFDKEWWAVLYLHDWDEDGGIYPEVHGFYDTMDEAIADVATKKHPENYHVRRLRHVKEVRQNEE